MQQLHCFFVMSALMTISISQEIPDECRQRPTGSQWKCCTIIKKNSDRLTKCIAEMKDRIPIGCFTDCIFGEDVFVDEKVDRDNLMLALTDFFEDSSSFNELHDPAVDYCIDAREKGIEYFSGEKRESRCDPNQIRFFLCVYYFYFNNCPADVWNSSDTCNAWQSYTRHCSFVGNNTMTF